jgi:hypothetical protein
MLQDTLSDLALWRKRLRETLFTKIGGRMPFPLL